MILEVIEQEIRDFGRPTKLSRNRFAEIFGDTFGLLGEGLPVQFSVFSTVSDAVKLLGLSDEEVEISEILKEMIRNLKKNAVI